MIDNIHGCLYQALKSIERDYILENNIIQYVTFGSQLLKK